MGGGVLMITSVQVFGYNFRKASPTVGRPTWILSFKLAPNRTIVVISHFLHFVEKFWHLLYKGR